MADINEELETQKPLLQLDTPDAELVERIDKSIERGKPLYENIRTRAKKNVDYWKAHQIEEDKLQDYEARVVNNLMFRNMETMLPVITKNTPTPKFISSAKDYDRKLEKVSVNRWEVQDRMLEKNRKAVRANFLDLLGVAKYRFDSEIDDIDWEYVPTDHVVIDPDATDIEDCGFVAEFIANQSVKEITERYPKKKAELLALLGISPDDSVKMGTPLRYVEFWTPEFVVWKYKTIIFDKAKNPNWDWGMQQETDEMGKAKPVAYNIWKKPRVPYIFLQTFNLGGMVYSDTSLIEQTLKIQDGINKRKRQISDNADNANGILAGSGDGISKDEFAKLNNGEPNVKVFLNGGADIDKMLRRIPGEQLQPYVFNDMIHSEGAVDDIWGTHTITRGAQGADEPATSKVLQQRQDYGRIDDIVKAYEDFNEQYYQASFQMMLIHYTNEHVFSFEDEDDLIVSREEIIKAYSKQIKTQQNEITGTEETVEEGDFRAPVIMVKRGSTLPTDDLSRRSEALELWGANGIDPISLYEKLDWPNARDAAMRLFQWTQNPMALFPEAAGAQPGGGAGGGQFSQGVIQDYEAIKRGQPVEPNPEVSDPQTAQAHIEGHNAIMDTQEWQQLDPSLQQLYLDHLKAEIEIAKQIINQGGGVSTPPEGMPVA